MSETKDLTKIIKEGCPFSRDAFKQGDIYRTSPTTNSGTPIGECSCEQSFVKGSILPKKDCVSYRHPEFFVTNCNIKFDYNFNFIERLKNYIPKQHGKVVGENKNG